MTMVLALTCGVAVANIYFPQAITPLIADGLRISPDAATAAVTATQIGYASGILLLVPLGDRIPYRRLLIILLGLTGLGLLAAGCAPNLPLLVTASLLIGLTTVGAQVIGPMAVGLVDPQRRGAVLGMLLSGSVGGMILARTFSGVLGEWWGWRTPYLVAATLLLFLVALLARTLPSTTPPSHEPYSALLAESLRLLRTEPRLRRSSFYQATVFGGFSAVWTALALLLTGSAYGFGTSAVGLVALVAGVTMFCTPIAGRWVDRRGPDPVNVVCTLAVLAAAPILAAGAYGGLLGLLALIIGTLLLDVAMQSGMVANQARVYALRPDQRSRLNTAYMTCAYLGGSVGTWFGLHIYSRVGWSGVCTLLGFLAVLVLIRHFLPVKPASRSVPAETPDTGNRSQPSPPPGRSSSTSPDQHEPPPVSTNDH